MFIQLFAELRWEVIWWRHLINICGQSEAESKSNLDIRFYQGRERSFELIHLIQLLIDVNTMGPIDDNLKIIQNIYSRSSDGCFLHVETRASI